jgi:hypothetical protein
VLCEFYSPTNQPCVLCPFLHATRSIIVKSCYIFERYINPFFTKRFIYPQVRKEGTLRARDVGCARKYKQERQAKSRYSCRTLVNFLQHVLMTKEREERLEINKINLLHPKRV